MQKAEEKSDSSNIDDAISYLGGCGCYQIVVTFFISLVRISAAMSMMLMTFGNYNPGWECLDNTTSIATNENNLTFSGTKTTPNDTDDNCFLFDSCSNVAFPSGMSTVVTEWQLICGQSWISSLIISLQMVGVLIGAYLSGYLGDRIGRKTTIFVASVYHSMINVIAVFSNSWQMFAAMRFLIGLAIPILTCLPVLLPLEFASARWRAAIVCAPICCMGNIIMVLCAMATENWRYLHGIIAAASFISILPFYWMPESLRWLVINGKMKSALAVVKSIAKWNGNRVDGNLAFEKIAAHYGNQQKAKKYSCFQLWRKGTRYPTFAIGAMVVFASIVYYAISFSVKSMPGDFYTNLLLLFVSEIPFAIVGSILPNYTGRKYAMILFLVVSNACLFTIVGLDLNATGTLRDTGMLVCAMIARGTVEKAWDVAGVYMVEFFPTVIRSTSVAYLNWISRIGGILAPFLIPDDPDTYYINYLIMAVGVFICCVMLIFLKETNGMPLQETWVNKASDLNINEHEANDTKYQDKSENQSFA